MLNQAVLVGRIVEEPTIKELENEKKVSTIILAVARAYKNAVGEYETDFIPCVLWDGIAENTLKYCHKGDLIAIKGRIQFKEDKLEVVAERVTFLSSKREDEK